MNLNFHEGKKIIEDGYLVFRKRKMPFLMKDCIKESISLFEKNLDETVSSPATTKMECERKLTKIE